MLADADAGIRKVPRDVVSAKGAPYRRYGTPWHRPAMQNLDDFEIVKVYGAEYRGIIQYYKLADNIWSLGALRWDAQTSMLKTLAAKHDSTVAKMAARHRARIRTSGGIRTCFEARVERDGKPPLVARFGGIPLTRNRDAILTDRAPKAPAYPRKELVTRLMAGRCELCGDYDKVRVHQVRALASLDGTGTDRPVWMTAMARKRRKTLVVCRRCHDAIHGHPTPDTA